MRIALALVIALLAISPLSAAVVGVILEFAGDVRIQRAGSTYSRPARVESAVRDTDTLLVKSGSVSVLALSGKVLRFDKAGAWKVTAAGALVTMDDLVASATLRRTTTSDLGAARSRSHTMERKSDMGNKNSFLKEDTEEPFELLAPASAQLDTRTWFAWRATAGKKLEIKSLVITAADKPVWAQYMLPEAVVKQGLFQFIAALKSGVVYRCEAVYQLDGRQGRYSKVFQLLDAAKGKEVQGKLDAIDRLDTPEAAKHYLRSLVLAGYGAAGQSLAEYAAAKALNPALGK